MASISKQADGRIVVQFVGTDRKRRSIRLGKVSDNAAQRWKAKIEELTTASKLGDPIGYDVARWVQSVDDKKADVLAAGGLIPKREQRTLGAFLENWIAKRTDVEPGTRTVYGHAKRNLIDFFGADKPLTAINAEQAQDWRRHLLTELAQPTVATRVKNAKQFFNSAVKAKLIAENPFQELAAGKQHNKEREFFVTVATVERVLDQCPNVEWKLMVALARFGGLRCPSEVRQLKWTDINWQEGKFLVTSPKTKRYGKATRLVPLFPELLPYLQDAFDAAEPGAVYVAPSYRDHTNLGTALKRYILNAGILPWQKPWQNMRSTRETELLETYPIHVVCAWIGNTPKVAAEHYLQVTDDHFSKAATDATHPRISKAVQKAVQQDKFSTAKHPVTVANSRENEALRRNATVSVGPEGFEPPTKGL